MLVKAQNGENTKLTLIYRRNQQVEFGIVWAQNISTVI